jgi:integrase
MQSYLDDLRRAARNSNTIRQYRGDYNKWVPPEIGELLLPQLSRQHWTGIFSHVSVEGSPSVVTNVSRTLSALLTWADEWEYFGPDLPFGLTSAARAEKVRKAKLEASRRREVSGTTGRGIRLEQCPGMEDDTALAEAVELVYPGYGRRMVWLGLGSGLRIGELLALRTEHVDLEKGIIHVTQQLDRNNHWPATTLPKGGKVRDAFLWTALVPIAASLAQDASAHDADDPGWLFPRHRSTVGWADMAGHLVGEAVHAIDWAWTFHWLRHAYASWLLAPPAVGGYGRAATDVQRWLGHQKLSTTLDTYVQATPGGLALARDATVTLPGM